MDIFRLSQGFKALIYVQKQHIHAIARLRIPGSIDPKALSDTTTFCAIESPVKKILKHLGLWDQKARPPPKANAPPRAPECDIDYTDYKVPVYDNLSRASRSNDYLYVNPKYPEVYTG
jgi:hypothetical protein